MDHFYDSFMDLFVLCVSVYKSMRMQQMFPVYSYHMYASPAVCVHQGELAFSIFSKWSSHLD